MLRYLEAFPSDIESAFRQGLPAILPIGALEWHGSHLPLGLDSIIAEHFAARIAEQLDAVLLPILNVPITTLPHPASLDVPTTAAVAVWEATAEGLVRAGAQTIVFLTGHYAQGHVIELYRLSIRLMDRHPIRVFAGSPLEPLGDDDLLDHAAIYEASQLMAIRPDLVCLDKVAELNPTVSAVLGQDPRNADARTGQILLEAAETAWVHEINTATAAQLRVNAIDREATYASYIAQFGEHSWEEGIQRWWATKG